MSIRPTTSIPPSSSALRESGNPILRGLSAIERDHFAPFLDQLWVETGTVVVQEGELDRALNFVLDLSACIGARGVAPDGSPRCAPFR